MGLSCQRRRNMLVTTNAKVLEWEVCAMCCYSQEDNKSTTSHKLCLSQAYCAETFPWHVPGDLAS